MNPTRLKVASGACLALGVVDVAWLDFAVAPAMLAAPEQEAQPEHRVAPRGLDDGTARGTSAAQHTTARASTATTAAPAADSPRCVVHFGFSSSDIEPEGALALDALVEELRGNPGAVVVEGHADVRGPPDVNRGLSLVRAQRVASFLVARGVPVARVETRAFGETRPISRDGSEPEQRRDRRVEVRVRSGGATR